MSITKTPTNHINTKTMKGAIFHPKKEIKQEAEEISNETMVFCLIGNEDELVNLDSNIITHTNKSYPKLWDIKDKDDIKLAEFRDEACAKINISNGKVYYYIKRNNHGRFLNPIGIYDEFRHLKTMKHAGRPEFRYDPVNKKVFELYLNFLQTKNSSWLINSEREAI